MSSAEAAGSYRIRRKVFTIFGASFHVYQGERLIAFCRQKAFKLKEDIRLYTDESMQKELMWIRAQHIIDFSAGYEVVDSQKNEVVGVLRRRGLKSLFRDQWEVADLEGNSLGQLVEDSMGMAMVRRFLSNLVPQTFHLDDPAGNRAVFRQRFNPIVYHLEVSVPRNYAIDRRLVLGAAILLSAIEGRQRN